MEIIRKDRKTININEQNTRIYNVAAYVRVSTEKDDQLNSFESQQKYYNQKINEHDNWKLIEIYADEGITGTSSKKRSEFNRMMNDAFQGKIDIIITKSISRFARNTVDTLKYVRLLKTRNVPVIFEEENINSLTTNGEFLLTVLSSVAQQESENISAHVRKGHEMLLKDGNILLGNGCLGYKFYNDEKRIEVIPEEAEVVKLIFKLFLERKNILAIKNYLEANNIKTYKNKDKWDKTGIKNILTNEKYVGDLLQGKTCKLGPMEKKRKNKGQANQYLIKNFHEAIISRSTFDKVQKIIKKNYEDKYNHDTHNIDFYSFRLKCGYCGHSVISSDSKNTGMFKKCSNRKKNGRIACPDSRDILVNKVDSLVFKSLRRMERKIINSGNPNLYYVKEILSNYNGELNEKLYEKIIKFIFVGGYDHYNRSSPFKIRIILFNNYPINDYEIKKITVEEIRNLITKKVCEEWISEDIITYGPPGDTYRRQIVSKVKVTFEVDETNCILGVI